MKIVIDARIVTDRYVGISRYILNLLMSLSPVLPWSKHTLVCLITNSFAEEQIRLIDGRIKCVYTKSKPLSFTEHFEIPFLLYKLKADLFHATSYMTPAWVPCKFVYSILDTYHLIFPGGFSKFAQFYFKFVVIPAAKRAKYIITISDASKSDIERMIKPGKPIKVTYLAANPVREKNEREVNLKYNINNKYFLYLGNHRIHKNAKRVLLAYQLVYEENNNIPDLVLNLNKNEEWLSLITNKNILSKCHFLSHIEEEDLPSFYSKAELLISPSLYEGFGLMLIEAMICGTPVITSNISSMPEVCGEAAVYIDPYSVESIASGIKLLNGNVKLREDLREKGLERVKLFSWRKCAEKTLNVYEKVLHEQLTGNKSNNSETENEGLKE